MTKEFINFILEHENDDTARLLLSAARYPAIDMPLAVQQLEGRRTAREKWPSLLAHDDYLYPPRLNREQASSEATAAYKASLTGRCGRMADLTGGMGVDSMALAAGAEAVDYVEQDPALCRLMEGNCRALGIGNVQVHCADSMAWIAGRDGYDWIYMDPARRNVAGRKVAAFEDCSPDILPHLPVLLAASQHLLVKASPMIDITLAGNQLGAVQEVHVLAVKGECKEVLFVCAPGHTDCQIHCIDIVSQGIRRFQFSHRQEQEAEPRYCTAVGDWLYEPHAALMKGGPFKLIGQRYGLQQLAPATHLYTSSTLVAGFPGRTFRVLRQVTLDRHAMKALIPGGKAHVVVRNFPQEAASLQKRLGLREGGDLFIIATTVGTRCAAFLCRQA